MSNFDLDTSNLQEKSEGELFSRQDYNAIVRALKSLAQTQEGLIGAGLSAISDKVLSRPDFFSTKIRSLIPEFAGLSFEPNATALPSEPAVVAQSTKPTNKTNNNLYLTNEGVKSSTETEMNFNGRIISQYVTTQLEVDATVPPEIGKVCGILNDDFKVTHDGTGLMCTNLYTENSKNYASVIAVGGVVNFLVKASSVVAKDTVGDFIVWYGTPGAEEESSPKIIYKAVNKTGKEINIASPSDPDADELFLMIDIYGSRYVLVIGSVNGRLGKTDTSISKGSSGVVSIWTGTPGFETDSGENVTAHNKFATIGATKWVWIGNNGDGDYLVAAECPLT